LVHLKTYTYDAAHRLTAVENDIDADSNVEETVAYRYDISGRRTELSIDNMLVTYQYDALGQLIAIDAETTGVPVTLPFDLPQTVVVEPGAMTGATLSYDGVGRHIATVRSNNVATSYDYDPAGRLTGLTHQDMSGTPVTLADFQYTLDGRGNRTAAVETLNGATPVNIAYTYDALSRLTEANYDSGTTVYSYGFDRSGNLTNMNGVTRTFNAANQMTGDGTNSYSYDANGNLMSNGTSSYTWDHANRMLTAPGSTSFAYDGNGVRISRTVSGVMTNYLQDTQPSLAKLLSETTDGTTTQYLHDPRGVHAQADVCGWDYHLVDGLGSVRMMVNPTATVLGAIDRDPYGNTISGNVPTPIGFTGEYMDGNGQIYLRARYYDPSIALFTALDPFEGVVSRPMSLNGYTWVEGRVINATDPTGEQICLSEICNDPLIPFTIRGSIGCFDTAESQAEIECEAYCNPHGLRTYNAAIATCTADCLERRADNAGGCRIEIYSFNALFNADIAPNHAFILFWNRDGNTGRVYHGQPDPQSRSAIALGTAKIKAHSNSHTPANPSGQYSYWSQTNGVGPRLLLSGDEACQRKSCLDYQVGQINTEAQNTVYSVGGPNSNTVARAFLENCDIPVYEPSSGPSTLNLFPGSLPGFYDRRFVE